jgi:hypothetical protein
LDNKDLSEVPTEKLFDLMMKYSNYLSKEGLELIFTQRSDTERLLVDPDVEEWKG